MSTRRHINLSLLSMERELADSLDNEEIIALFNSKPRRLRLVYSFYAGLPNSRTDTHVFMPAVVNLIFILMCIWIADFGLEVQGVVL